MREEMTFLTLDDGQDVQMVSLLGHLRVSTLRFHHFASGPFALSKLLIFLGRAVD